ncbi:HAD family hydrolase [Parasphingorhabdus pacifica]
MSSNNGSESRLVLWDIDLTLIDARGFGESWYRAALTEVTGRDLRRMPDTAGRTELAITTDALNNHGVEATETTVAAMFAALTSVVESSRDELASHGHAMPGAALALHALTETPEFMQTAVTGNLPSVALAKLDAFGLDRHLDFEIGGFGTDSVHRNDLISAAVAKAGDKHSTTFAPDDVVVVGDTPHDVAGALHSGAVAVGVATGGSDEGELRDAGAHVVLKDLADTEAVLAALRFRTDAHFGRSGGPGD